MAIQKTDLELFPEEYLLEEDEMGESNAQFELVHYLVEVLRWLFHIENWHISGNLELYHFMVKNSQHKITPDISVFKGILIPPENKQPLTSWDIGPGQDAPPVVFEISSASTWRSDIVSGEDNKPAIYGRMGIKEYFAYDPNEPAVWRATASRRLLGWRYENGQPVEIPSNGFGRIWSNELNSWLVANGPILRLYDRNNHLRFTEAEARFAETEAEKKNNLAKDLAIETMNQRLTELERQLRELRDGKE